MAKEQLRGETILFGLQFQKDTVHHVNRQKRHGDRRRNRLVTLHQESGGE